MAAQCFPYGERLCSPVVSLPSGHCFPVSNFFYFFTPKVFTPPRLVSAASSIRANRVSSRPPKNLRPVKLRSDLVRLWRLEGSHELCQQNIHSRKATETDKFGRLVFPVGVLRIGVVAVARPCVWSLSSRLFLFRSFFKTPSEQHNKHGEASGSALLNLSTPFLGLDGLSGVSLKAVRIFASVWQLQS